MPTYTFTNTKTGKEFTEMMTIAEMESYLKKNKHIKQNISGIRIVAGVSGQSYRSDSGWKEVQSKIAEAHPMSALAKEMGTRSTKQIKTEQVVKSIGLDKMQKINNIGVQSEQLNNNGRIPESNKSIRSLHLPKQGEN